MILARAGLERLGLENEIAQIIPADLMVPAVGQGALGIEIPVDDPNVASIVAAIEHRPTRQVTDEERAFLRRLEGGCQAPIAAHGWIVGEELRLTGLVASLDGREIVRKNRTGNLDKEIGRELAEDVLREGGEIILEGISIGR